MANLIRTDFLLGIRSNLLGHNIRLTGISVDLFHYSEVDENIYGDRVPQDDLDVDLQDDVAPVRSYMKFVPKQGLALLEGFEVYFEEGAVPLEVFFPVDTIISRGDKVVVTYKKLGGAVDTYSFKVIDLRQKDMAMDMHGQILVRLSPWRDSYLEIEGKLEVPVVSLPSGTYSSSRSVTITTEVAQGIIKYTTNGSDPNVSGILYTSALTIAVTTELRAIVIKDGFINSDIVLRQYVIGV